MAADLDEDDALRSVALRNANAILQAQRRAEEQLLQASHALEARSLELHRSLSLMQATLESTADAIVAIGNDGRILTCNQRYLDLYRRKREQVEGALHEDLLRELLHEHPHGDQILRRIRQINARPADEALDVVEVGGRVLERFSRPQWLDGSVIGRVWSLRDITQRVRAEESLREEARVLDLLNRTGQSIAASLDLHAILQSVTDAATQLGGAEIGAFFYNTTDADTGDAYQLYTLSGAPREAFEGFGHPRATPLFGPTFQGEAPVCIDDVLRDPRYGQWAPHHGMPPGHLPVRSYLAVPVGSPTGGTVGGLFFGHSQPGRFSERTQQLVVGIAAQASVAIENARLYEQTQRVAEEREQLIEAERAARVETTRVSQLKDEFLAVLSHELRTPLTAILGWAKVLLNPKHDPNLIDRGLATIERNAVAQARLIDDLLDMNRFVSGKVRLDVRPTDLTTVVEEALMAIRPSAEAKQLSLVRVLDPNAGTVAGDPHRLQQVVWNLLTNAVKFTPRGGSIEVLLRRKDANAEIVVSDTGVGIAAPFLPSVFDRFRQADSSITRSHGGLGLGLSIVKQLVDMHGGTVQARSAGEGRGSTFIVTLPTTVLRVEPPRGPAEALAPSPSPPAADLRGMTILVVDDDADTRELMRQILADCHAQVRTAASVDEALADLLRQTPDLLVSDIGMPGRDGYDLMREVRRLDAERGGKVPAVAITAFARPEDRVRSLMAGYQLHLSKPIDPHELVATAASLRGQPSPPTSR